MAHKEVVHLLLLSVSVFHYDFSTSQNPFVVFPSFLPTQTVREGYYKLWGKRKPPPLWESERVEVARQSWVFCVRGGLVSWVMCTYVSLKKSQFLCRMENLFTKGYGITFLCIFRTWTHVLKAMLAPDLDGGKRHDEEEARFEPWALAFGPYTHPLCHRRYLSTIENIC